MLVSPILEVLGCGFVNSSTYYTDVDVCVYDTI